MNDKLWVRLISATTAYMYAVVVPRLQFGRYRYTVFNPSRRLLTQRDVRRGNKQTLGCQFDVSWQRLWQIVNVAF